MKYLFHVNVINYIPVSGPITVGRVSGEVIIPDTKLSSKHMSIHVENEYGETAYYLEDLGSKNRTILNRVEVQPGERKRLRLEGYIEAGNQQFIFTDKNNLSIEDINRIVDQNRAKQVKKLEGVQLMQDLLNKKLDEITRLQGEQSNHLEAVKQNEADIENLRQAIMQTRAEADEKLRALERERQRLNDLCNVTIQEFNNRIEAHNLAISDLKNKAIEAGLKAADVKAKLPKNNPDENV